jgi:hypothetical protein
MLPPRPHDPLGVISSMDTANALMEKHHRTIIYSLAFVVVFFAAACTFHDVIPVCHYLFGCDHHLHTAI